MRKAFKFDPHMHTAETSKCGRIPASKLADIYCALGYSGVAITDHLHEEYISLLYCRDDWDTCVDRFLDGYKRAKKRGDEIGLHVVLGAEIRFPANGNDYLLYGIDEDFLRRNPYLYRMTPWDFFERFGNELLIIQAHPFRDGNREVFNGCFHGVEIVNGNLDHKNCNEKALELCMANPGLYRVCGSDTHRVREENHAWMLFDSPVSDSFAFKSAVERGGYRLDCVMEDGKALLRREADFFSSRGPSV